MDLWVKIISLFIDPKDLSLPQDDLGYVYKKKSSIILNEESIVEIRERF